MGPPLSRAKKVYFLNVLHKEFLIETILLPTLDFDAWELDISVHRPFPGTIVSEGKCLLSMVDVFDVKGYVKV